MKRIILSLFLVLSMVVSMAVPALAADYDYTDYEFTLLLLPRQAMVEVGDIVDVELRVFGVYPDGEPIDSFDFWEFEETIKFDDRYFTYVDDSAVADFGLDFDIVDDDEIKIAGDDLDTIENGEVIFSFQLEAKKKGYADLTQKSITAKRNRSYDYYDEDQILVETNDVRAVADASTGDGYTITTKFDEDCGDVYISTTTADEDDEVKFWVVAFPGHEIDDVEVLNSDDDEIDYDIDTDDRGYKYYVFDMPDDDVTIEVYFDDSSSSGKEYDITLDYSADKGFAYLSKVKAEKGDKVRVYVDPDEDGYDVTVTAENEDGDEVEVEWNDTNEYYYFYMPAGDVDVDVEIEGTSTSTETKYNVVVLSYDEDCGSVTAPSKAAEDDTVRFYIYLEDDYEVDKVIIRSRVDGEKIDDAEWDSDGYWYFKMPDEDVAIDVEFDEEGTSSSGKEYKINVGYDDDYGSVTVVNKAKKGDKVKLYLYPDNGYKVEDIEITEDETGDSVDYSGDLDDDYVTFRMPSDDVDIYVDFVRGSGSTSTKYDINLEYDEDHGTVDISRTTAAKGKEITITPDPDSGYVVYDVTVTRTGSSTTRTVYEEEDDYGDTYYYFIMPAYDVDVEVTFVKKGSASGRYAVTIDSDIEGGEVESSAIKADKGDEVELTVKPDKGYEIDKVSVVRTTSNKALEVIKNKDGTYSFIMPDAKVTVSATFKKAASVTYAVTVDSAVKNGTIKTSATTAESGNKITVTLTPATGYSVGQLTVTKGTAKTAVSTTKVTNDTYTFTMPAEKVTVSATFNKNLTPGAHVCAAKAFTDVDTSATSWYHEAADYVVSNGLMNGTSGTTFEPNTETSRGMIVTVLWRLAGKPLSNAEIPYTDVAAGEWYTEAIRWAAANNLLADIATTGAIEPNASLTREQIASIIYRFVKYNGGGYTGIIQVDLSKFNDADEISPWAVAALGWCNENGVLKGDNTTGKLMPKGNVTRAQFAQILLNYANLEK